MDTKDDKFRKSKRVLLDERPLVLLPSLAKAVGVNEAVIIQQLHFHLMNPDNGRKHDGKQWIYKTYEEWQETDFQFWSTRTIRRLFRSLEKKGLIKSCQPEGRDSRLKYYRIDYERLKIFRARAQEAAKSGASMRPKVALPLIRDDSTKTTLTKKVRTTHGLRATADSDLVFEGKGKAIQGKKNLQDNSGILDSKKKGRENFASRNGARKPIPMPQRNRMIKKLNERKASIYRDASLTPEERERAIDKTNHALQKL